MEMNFAMDTNKLAELLMEKMNWGPSNLAEVLGVSRQNTYQNIKRIRNKNRKGFRLSIVSLAFKHGLEAEAISVLMDNESKPVSSVLRAAIMYTDLKPNELEKLLAAEEMMGMSPLSTEIIKSIVNKCRAE